MKRRHRRWLARGGVIVGAIAGVALATTPARRSLEARARADLLSEIGRPLVQPTRPPRPGATERPCRSGHKMAVALGGTEPLDREERARVEAFLEAPSSSGAASVRDLVEGRAGQVRTLLEAASCREHGPIPSQPGDLPDLLDLADLGAAGAWLHIAEGDPSAALDRAVALWALGARFGEDRLIVFEAGLRIRTRAVDVVDHLVGTGRITPIHLVPALPALAHLVRHPPDLGFAVLQDARDATREVVRGSEGRVSPLRRGVRAHLARAGRVHELLALPWPERRSGLLDLDSRAPGDPIAARLWVEYSGISEVDGAIRSREAVTLVGAGLRVWSDVHGSCPSSPEALVPEVLSELPVDPLSGDPLRMAPAGCGVASAAGAPTVVLEGVSR